MHRFTEWRNIVEPTNNGNNHKDTIVGSRIFVEACERLGFFLLDVSCPPESGWTWESIGRCERLSGDMRTERQYMALMRPRGSQSLQSAQTSMRLCIDITRKDGEKVLDWCNGFNARRSTTKIPFTRIVVSRLRDFNLLIPPTKEESDPMTLSFSCGHVQNIVNRLSVVDLSEIELRYGIHCVGSAAPALWISQFVPFCPPS